MGKQHHKPMLSSKHVIVNNTAVDMTLGLTLDQFGNAVRCFIHALIDYDNSQLSMFKDDYEFWAGRLINVHGVSVEEVQVIEATLLN